MDKPWIKLDIGSTLLILCVIKIQKINSSEKYERKLNNITFFCLLRPYVPNFDEVHNQRVELESFFLYFSTLAAIFLTQWKFLSMKSELYNFKRY